MKLYPHQKLVQVWREDAGSVYTVINNESLTNAARRLSNKDANAFILWCYFTKNQNGYPCALSNVDVYKTFGLSKRSYDHSVQVLMREGFLRCDHDQIYIFEEYPASHKAEYKSAVSAQSKSAETAQREDDSLCGFRTRNNTIQGSILQIGITGQQGAQKSPEGKSLSERARQNDQTNQTISKLVKYMERNGIETSSASGRGGIKGYFGKLIRKEGVNPKTIKDLLVEIRKRQSEGNKIDDPVAYITAALKNKNEI